MTEKNTGIKFRVAVIVIFIIQFIAIGLMATHIIFENNEKSIFDMQKQDAYTLYIGLNHKDTNEPVMSVEEAKTVVTEICCKYIDGLTMYEGGGVWKDDEGELVNENTLICIIYTEDSENEQKIASLADELIATLHQNCILIEHSDHGCTYYYGN